jgi:hypothetical protein
LKAISFALRDESSAFILFRFRGRFSFTNRLVGQGIVMLIDFHHRGLSTLTIAAIFVPENPAAKERLSYQF